SGLIFIRKVYKENPTSKSTPQSPRFAYGRQRQTRVSNASGKKNESRKTTRPHSKKGATLLRIRSLRKDNDKRA
ncbi:MAG: hypothetical protein IIU02_03870, partial [Treponema sp.]|uniref:hypothetical protein n=1 Tax=Treponema sp. TaxID=166 RepID=UPI00257C8663